MVVLLIMLLGALSADEPIGDSARLKGPVKTVLAERVSIVSREAQNRHPWYRQIYDSRGRLIESTFFKEDGLVNNSWIYAYDNDGKRTEAAVYDSNGVLRWKEQYAYDEKQLVREVYLLEPGGASTVRYAFKYDSMGRRTAWLRSEKSGHEVLKEAYRYDSTGRICEELLYVGSGTLDSRFTYTYDRQGNLRSKQEYSNGSLAHHWLYRYEYDSRGNWVKQTAFDRKDAKSDRPAVPSEIVYRRIEYWENR